MLGMLPGLFGYRPVRIFGTSMEPALRNGDALLVKQVPPAGLKVGDIVGLESSSGQLFTHRVVRIEGMPQGDFLIRTKGDANPSPEWTRVAATEKVGVAILRIPKMGYILEFIQSLPGVIFLAANAIVLVVVLVPLIQRHIRHQGG